MGLIDIYNAETISGSSASSWISTLNTIITATVSIGGTILGIKIKSNQN